MKFNTNKEKGNSGLGIAIGYLSIQGHIVSIPINDTQDYDLVVDINNELKRVQVKATAQSKRGNTVVSLRSMGGTRGTVYKTVRDSEADILLVVNEKQEIWLIPVSEITQINELTLTKKWENYKKTIDKKIASCIISTMKAIMLSQPNQFSLSHQWLCLNDDFSGSGI